MENVRIETALREYRGTPLIEVTGEIDIYTSPEFKEAMASAIDLGKPDIIIDLAKVTYMDSSGFGTLLSATKRLRPLNGSLHLVACNEPISRMLQITRLNTIFAVHDTLDEAAAAITANVAARPVVIASSQAAA